MLLHTQLTAAVVLACTFSHAFPGIVSKRQDVGTTNFNFDTYHCQRSQDQRDLITTELGIALDMAKAAADAALDSNNKWSRYFLDDETLKRQILSSRFTKTSQSSMMTPITSFTMLHELTHLNYATKSDGVPAAENKRALDYAYQRPNCKSLRDGTRINEKLCKDFPNNVCPATLSFRNADTRAFAAAGIYWEEQCNKTIAIEPEAGVTEYNDPVFNDDLDAGPETPDPADDEPTPLPPIGPLTSCSPVETIMTGTIAPGPQTYCTCGSIIAGVNTETSGSLVYSVCAGDPFSTVATGTIADAPLPTITATTPPAEVPDLSSPACTSCTGTLGASDCNADDDQCLIEQCRSDKDCQTCGIECDSFGA